MIGDSNLTSSSVNVSLIHKSAQKPLLLPEMSIKEGIYYLPLIAH